MELSGHGPFIGREVNYFPSSTLQLVNQARMERLMMLLKLVVSAHGLAMLKYGILPASRTQVMVGSHPYSKDFAVFS
jgi:hypothetical protein